MKGEDDGVGRTRKKKSSDKINNISDDADRLSMGLSDLFEEIRSVIYSEDSVIVDEDEIEIETHEEDNEIIQPTDFSFDLDARSADGIRSLFADDFDLLGSTIEIDEQYKKQQEELDSVQPEQDWETKAGEQDVIEDAETDGISKTQQIISVPSKVVVRTEDTDEVESSMNSEGDTIAETLQAPASSAGVEKIIIIENSSVASDTRSAIGKHFSRDTWIPEPVQQEAMDVQDEPPEQKPVPSTIIRNISNKISLNRDTFEMPPAPHYYPPDPHYNNSIPAVPIGDMQEKESHEDLAISEQFEDEIKQQEGTADKVEAPTTVEDKSGLLKDFNKLFKSQQTKQGAEFNGSNDKNGMPDDTAITDPYFMETPTPQPSGNPLPMPQPQTLQPQTLQPQAQLPLKTEQVPPGYGITPLTNEQTTTPNQLAKQLLTIPGSMSGTILNEIQKPPDEPEIDVDTNEFITGIIHVGDATESADDVFIEDEEIVDEKLSTRPTDIKNDGLEPPDIEAPDGYELMDNYWVNHPFCSIAIMKRTDTHDLLFYLVEPELDVKAQDLMTKLTEHLRDILSRGKLAEKFDRSEMLESNTDKLLHIYGMNVKKETREILKYYLHRDFIGFGKIDGFMKDPNIEDISCDGVDVPIFIYHRKYQNIPSNVKFKEDELDIMVIRLAQRCGKHVSIGSPITQATLPDGSRLEATLGREVTTRGSAFTIRRFRSEPFSPIDLAIYNTYTPEMLAYMWLVIENNMSFIIAGGTASGKTSTLNAMSIFIPPSAKIISIEDTRELTLYHQNWVPKVTRDAVKGRSESEIGMFDLLRSALRERPEFILVGEVRGPEAQVLFQAMNTGHTTYSTMHAGTVQAAVNRLLNEPINIPIMMMQALNVVLIQGLMIEGGKKTRRSKSIVEITSVDQRTGNLSINEVFRWSADKGEYEHKSESFVFQIIKNNRGWSEKQLADEIDKRKNVLRYLVKNDIHKYEDVAPIIESFYRNPDLVMNRLKSGEL